MSSDARVLLIGGGGFAKEVLDYHPESLEAAMDGASVIGVLCRGEPDPDVSARVPHLGAEDDFSFRTGDSALLAIGDGAVRAKVAAALAARGVRLATLTHRTAWRSPSAVVEDGCVLAPFAFVGAAARLGRGGVLNTYASVGHDADVGPFCTFSPYAAVNGKVRLGERVFLGSQAVVVPGVAVGKGSKIAAGAVVNRDQPAGSLLAGAPATGRVMFRESD